MAHGILLVSHQKRGCSRNKRFEASLKPYRRPSVGRGVVLDASSGPHTPKSKIRIQDLWFSFCPLDKVPPTPNVCVCVCACDRASFRELLSLFRETSPKDARKFCPGGDAERLEQLALEPLQPPGLCSLVSRFPLQSAIQKKSVGFS